MVYQTKQTISPISACDALARKADNGERSTWALSHFPLLAYVVTVHPIRPLVSPSFLRAHRNWSLSIRRARLYPAVAFPICTNCSRPFSHRRMSPPPTSLSRAASPTHSSMPPSPHLLVAGSRVSLLLHQIQRVRAI